MSSIPNVPAGMVIVTEREFFAALYADRRDIMPSQASPDYTSWETPTRAVWGRSLPGWKRSREPEVYMLTEAAHAAIPPTDNSAQAAPAEAKSLWEKAQ